MFFINENEEKSKLRRVLLCGKSNLELPVRGMLRQSIGFFPGNEVLRKDVAGDLAVEPGHPGSTRGPGGRGICVIEPDCL